MDVQWRKDPRVHRSNGKLGKPRFPMERVDPRVGIFLSPLDTHDGFYLSSTLNTDVTSMTFDFFVKFFACKFLSKGCHLCLYSKKVLCAETGGCNGNC